MGLYYYQLRTASVYARNDVLIGSFNKSEFNSTIRFYLINIHKDKLDFFKNIPMFSDIRTTFL